MSNETFPRYPFSLTIHMKNGTPLFLERPIHLNGEWEMCLNQLYIPKSQISIYTDSTLEFKIELVPKRAPKTEKHRLWNEKLKNLNADDKAQLINVKTEAGNYESDELVNLINNVIESETQFQSYIQRTKLTLSNGKSFFRELPRIRDVQGRTAIQLPEEIKTMYMNRELAYLLGFVNHPKHDDARIEILNSSKQAILSSHLRPPNGGIFYYFLYIDLIDFQMIGNQKAPLLRITPAIDTNVPLVKSIQFEHLYYYKLSKSIITQITPEIRSEFGELIKFKYAYPLYVFHFRPRGFETV